MSVLDHQPLTTAIAPATQLGLVALTVADLDRSIAFYTQALGFTTLERAEARAILGVAGTPLLALDEKPGALPFPVDGVTGLYHFAILVPTRADLGRWLRNYLARGYELPGQGDHLVSEALYIRDPDFHGIEVYRDRPRSEWRWVNGQVRMGTGPVDIRGVLADADREGAPWSGFAAGTRLGHIHLQVGGIQEANAFYHGLLGFDIVAQMPMALFISAGGYHHHIGLNTWHSQGAGPAGPDIAQLKAFTVDLPSEEARAAVIHRLERAGVPTQPVAGTIAVRDPWHNVVLLQVGELRDGHSAAHVMTEAEKAFSA